MEWQDEAIILGFKPYGESNAIVRVLSCNHGLARGFVRGGNSRKKRSDLQPGNRVMLTWRARLQEQLGRFTYELLSSPMGDLITSPKKLLAMSAIISVIDRALPDGEKYQPVYDALIAFIDLLVSPDVTLRHIAQSYVHLELGLLSELGFGLDLSCCASSGVTHSLTYVSPKSGRAVSFEAGTPYRDKLLPLPAFLIGEQGVQTDDHYAKTHQTESQQFRDAFRLAGYFFARYIWTVHGVEEPQARTRFCQMIEDYLTKKQLSDL